RPAVLRVLVVTAQVNGLLRTHLLAVAAEDAAELVNLEDQGIAVPFLVFARNQLDAVRRAHRRTQPAGDALGLARLRREHAVSSTPPGRDLPLLLRILHGDLVRIHEMLEGARESLESGPHVAHLLQRPLHHTY